MKLKKMALKTMLVKYKSINTLFNIIDFFTLKTMLVKYKYQLML